MSYDAEREMWDAIVEQDMARLAAALAPPATPAPRPIAVSVTLDGTRTITPDPTAREDTP